MKKTVTALNRLRKFIIGGKVIKYENPAQPLVNVTDPWETYQTAQNKLNILTRDQFEKGKEGRLAFKSAKETAKTDLMRAEMDPTVKERLKQESLESAKTNITNISTNLGQNISGVNFDDDASWKDVKNKDGESLLSENAAMGIGMAAKIGTQAINLIDDATMGDKNFGVQSAAIDTAVHGASSALMKSGNPYAMAAGAALEVGNFATKATGQTVSGFDVDINSTGYGNMGHMESSSSRDFGALIGMGGVFNQKKMQRKLQERNDQAMMAMKAANITDEIKFEQEARMNSVEDVVRANQQALAGGVDTSLLGN